MQEPSYKQLPLLSVQQVLQHAACQPSTAGAQWRGSRVPRPSAREAPAGIALSSSRRAHAGLPRRQHNTSQQASWERCQPEAQALSPDPARPPPQAAPVGNTRAHRGVMWGEHHHGEGQGDAHRPQVGDGGVLAGGAASRGREGRQQVLQKPVVLQQGTVVGGEGCRTRSAISQPC